MTYKKQKQLRLNDFNLIDSLLKDEVAVSGKSESQIIEDIIISNYLSNQWSYAVARMYEQNLSISQTLSFIWMKAADLDSGDMLTVVKYAADKTFICNGCPDASSIEWPHFIGLLDSLKGYLEFQTKEDNSVELQKDIEWLKDIIKAYDEKDTSVSLNNIYRIIIGHWDILSDKAKIYNLLQSMAEIQTGWENSPKDRLELIKILK